MIDGHEMRFLLYVMHPKGYQQTLPLMGATRPALKAKAFTDRRVISAACEPLLGV